MLNIQKHLADQIGDDIQSSKKAGQYSLFSKTGHPEVEINIDGVQVSTKGKFMDISLENSFVEKQIMMLHNMKDSSLVTKNDHPLHIMVDFSSPNVAKELHVGHLRSTIIGDVISRMNEAVGNKVERINHVGDFGLPFGMITELIISENKEFSTIYELQDIYREAKKKYDESKDFKVNALKRTCDIQAGVNYAKDIWVKICGISKDAYDDIYHRLDIKIVDKGESTYVDIIPDMVKMLEADKLLTKEDGRQVIHIEGSDLPLTIVKSDGGYTYDTTDMAALWSRINANMDKIYYVVDARQASHFNLLFKSAKKLGWNTPLQHVSFGIIKGKDGKPLKSRSGDAYPLQQLLEEAIIKVKDVSESVFGNKTIDCESVAYTVIKFYELSHKCDREYVFDMDNMVSLNGKSGMYILYTLVRAKSITRKIPEMAYESIKDNGFKFVIGDKAQFEMATFILKFPEIFHNSLSEVAPHKLALYLYDMCAKYSQFVTKNRILFFDKNNNLSDINKVNMILTLCFIKVAKCIFELLGLYELEYV